MTMKHGLLVLAAALAAACSTRPNPGVCCIGAEDCSRLGLSEDRPCLAGQACVDFHCVAASCSNQGCPAEAPICDVATDACRGCQLDTECPSGACGDDGTCVAEDAIVYLAPDGVDTGTCIREAPCRDLNVGASRATAVRNHIVMASGTYVNMTLHLGTQTTSAPTVFIHGGGAVVENEYLDGTPMFGLSIPTTIRDMNIRCNSCRGIAVYSTARLERLIIMTTDNSEGIRIQGSVAARDIMIDSNLDGTAVFLESGTLTLDRATLKNGRYALRAPSASTVDVSNVLAFNTTDVAFDLSGYVSGSISFVTIADTGISSTTASGISCASTIPVRSTIIWTPGSGRPPISGCQRLSIIAGPIGVAGASDDDPLFVDPSSRNYHLQPTSPARDIVDSGPPFDFEGDPRPHGPRFDIGADESQ